MTLKEAFEYLALKVPEANFTDFNFEDDTKERINIKIEYNERIINFSCDKDRFKKIDDEFIRLLKREIGII